MANSLRDQLLKAGFVGKAKPKPSSARHGKPGKRADQRRSTGTAATVAAGEVDLARAYALRAKVEAGERRREKAAAEHEAQVRKERKRKLRETLCGAALNKIDADLVRHFEYGGKIRRVHVDAAQLTKLNAGDLAVVQQAGRYVLVRPDIAEKVRAFAPEHIALQLSPGEGRTDEDGVPDDLVW